MYHKDSAETVSYKKLPLLRKIAISSRIRLPASNIVLWGGIIITRTCIKKGFGFPFSIIDCRSRYPISMMDMHAFLLNL